MGRLADAGFPRPGSSVFPVSPRREHQPTMRPAGSTESSPAARQRSPRHAATSRGRGSRHSEAYGFVGSIAASATALAYIAWAYAPEPWLCHIGATYYPNRRWAVAVPAFVAVAVAQGVVLYVASNFLMAPAPACFNTISDEHAREQPASSPRTGADQAIQSIADIGIDRMNHLMFGEQGFHSLPRGWTQLNPS